MCQTSHSNTPLNQVALRGVEKTFMKKIKYPDFPNFMSFMNFVINDRSHFDSIEDEKSSSILQGSICSNTDPSLETLVPIKREEEKNTTPTSSDIKSCNFQSKLNVLNKELSNTKEEIEQCKLLYTNYIEALSSFILYTNVMILLLYFIIALILFSYPFQLYSYFYSYVFYSNALFIMK